MKSKSLRKYGGFATIKSQVGLNSYKLSVNEWAAQTAAIGLVAKTGRCGDYYAHSDLKFGFGMWISPEFKICLIKPDSHIQDVPVSRRKDTRKIGIGVTKS